MAEALLDRSSRREAEMASRKDESKRGRPAMGKQVNVRIPDALMADLEAISLGTGLDLSDVIRMILTENKREYLDRLEQKKKPKDRHKNN
jgi:uncharacterized protein YdeI (YjbR/CyaY-like superfamily)